MICSITILQQQRLSKMIPATTDITNGWACFGKGKPLIKSQFPFTQFGDNSIDMDIICCGICNTNIQWIDSDLLMLLLSYVLA